MRKLFANLISAPIINKPLRHRIRGIILYGVLRAILLRFKIKKHKGTPKYKLSICAIAKNEGPYLKEWIEFHKLVGVEKFYIYDNDSDDNTTEILRPYVDAGLVEYVSYPGQQKQLDAYNDCLLRYRFDSEWIAFIDIDEFIVPVQDLTVPKFLSKYSDYSAVEINWLCYGSDGQKHKTKGGVIKRFKAHSEYNYKLNRHIKSIVQPTRALGFMVSAHDCTLLSGKAVDVNKNIITRDYSMRDPVGQDIIRINHYAIKSRAEFDAKAARGRARPGKSRGEDYWNKYDQNQIKNDTVMERFEV